MRFSACTDLVRQISHLSQLVLRGLGWVAVLQCTKFYQCMPSDSTANISIPEARSQHAILHCINPPFLWPPSHSHLSHHSNIFLPISPTYMSIPLKTSPPHAYCYRFYFGLLPYTIICYMVFPVYIVNVSEHPHLSSTYPVFLSLCQGPDLITIHQCWFYCRFVQQHLEFGGNFLIAKHSCQLSPSIPCLLYPLYNYCSTSSLSIYCGSQVQSDREST